MQFLKKINAVAIDGPAGSGKSTISRLLAKKLGYTYLDTGAMYRALTLKVMFNGINFSDTDAVIGISKDTDIQLIPSDDDKKVTTRVILDGKDVSEEIRTLEVTGNVKYVARIPEVREVMVDMQRKMAASSSGAVMEGRDIGTVVLPNAKCKVYLDANFDERVERRFFELKTKGTPAAREAVAEDLKARDHSDKTRNVGPLKVADDAHVVDTTNLTIEQVVEKISEIVNGS